MRGLLRSENGVALPVAAGMLMVISILAVGFFTVATRVNTSSVADRSSKRALAAAEAGLQTAVYRLNLLNRSAPDNAANCLTTTWVAPTTGECPGQPESIGNGAEYTYYVTPADGAAGCVTLPGVPTTTQDRCVTSVGIANGVKRRVQTRVVSQSIFPPFNQVGLIGKSLVFAYNSANLNSDVGSNLRVVFENSVNVYDNDAINVDGKVMLLQGGTYQYENSVKIDGGTQTITTPFALNLPDSELERVENSSNNNNSTLATDLGSAWNPTTRRINIASGEKTIRPGIYHVCGVTLGNSVKLKFSHTGGALTQIWVDSPSRPGSEACAGQSDIHAGTFTADNSVEVNKEVGEREELLDIYMWGTPQNDTRDEYPWCSPIHHPTQTATCRSDFMLDNSVNFYGSVYAPNSTIQAHNSVKFYGATAGDKIIFFNSVDFFLTGEIKDKDFGSLGAAQRRGWAECRPQPTVATDPESGC